MAAYSDEDYYYGDEEEGDVEMDYDYEEEEEEEEGDAEMDFEDDDKNDDNFKTSGSKKHYTVLQESEIRSRQEDAISHVSSTLFVSRPDATTLLYHYKWDPSSVLDDWFDDEQKVRSKTGLLLSTHRGNSNLPKECEILCGICFEVLPLDDSHFYPSRCGHLYCSTCLNMYITISINEGPGCLSLRCPEPKCQGSISRDMVEALVGEEGRNKYERYLVRSFIEERRKAAKWCPAPGCENAVELDLDLCSSDMLVVECNCNHVFCWKCAEESHGPADCETVSKWILKNSSESENTAWILANSKPCPKCSRAIEKNHGCMHMTCTAPCRYQFCWLCLGDWSQHSNNYSCNKYQEDKEKGVYDAEVIRRRLAKQHVVKYTHYYERWVSNHKSREKAVQEMIRAKTVQFQNLSKILDLPETDFEFILSSWEQIIECRRVLKWTYVYGYYIPDQQYRKRKLFEYLQGQAEANLERLHQCLENELREFEKPLKQKKNSGEAKMEEEKQRMIFEEEKGEKFKKFRQNLLLLTMVTGSHFENLVRDLKNGLSELDAEEDGVGQDTVDPEQDVDELNQYHHWTCGVCTYGNPNTSRQCAMCMGDRPTR